METDWGQGAKNNNIGWGQGAVNNNIGWGSVHANSWSGDTDIVGQTNNVDADAQEFFNRVTTAGGTLTSTEQSAVNALVVQMKANNIWNSMKAIYPMVGSSAAACAQNLKSNSFTGTFTSGWTFASNGITPNGTSAYMTTGFIVNTEQASANNFSLGVYSGTIGGAAGVRCSMGAYNGSIETMCIIRFQDNKSYLCIGENTYNNTFTNNDTHGFYVANRNTTNFTQAWKNGVKIVDVANTPAGKQTNQIFLGAEGYSVAGVESGAISFDNKRNQFAFMSDGLSDANQGNLYTAVQAFQTTLLRNI